MKNKKGLIGIIAAVVAVAVLAFAYTSFAPKASEGAKNITIEVITEAQESTVYEVNTDAEFLAEAFDDAEGLVIDSEMGEYGMVINGVNGEEAVWDVNGAYWAINVNGEYGMYGASEQVVNDGDAFQLVFTKG